MKGRMLRAVAVCSLVALAGCSATSPVVSPRPWDKYGGDTLRVYGARRGSAGRVIYDALRDEPNLRRFLERQGEPDTLEVQGSRWSRKTIVLRYTRPSADPPRLIILEPYEDGFIPRAPVPLGPSRPATKRPPRGKPSAQRPAPRRAAEKPEASDERDDARARVKPSAEQALGCPIDPDRADCQAFCTPGADHEWCSQ